MFFLFCLFLCFGPSSPPLLCVCPFLAPQLHTSFAGIGERGQWVVRLPSLWELERNNRVSLEGNPWPGYHPVNDTWCPYGYGQTKQKRGLNNVDQVNPKNCYLKERTLACKAGTSRLQNLANVDSEDQPAASQMSEMDTPLDHAQDEAMPLVEWALIPMGHCNPEEEYASGRMGSDSDGALQPRGGVC